MLLWVKCFYRIKLNQSNCIQNVLKCKYIQERAVVTNFDKLYTETAQRKKICS